MIAEKFEAFHEQNPHVYDAFVRLAREWRAATGKPTGINALSEVVRWELNLKTADASYEYKLCNTYRPFYARLIMAREPELAGIFELRSSEADEWIGEYLSRNDSDDGQMSLMPL